MDTSNARRETGRHTAVTLALALLGCGSNGPPADRGGAEGPTYGEWRDRLGFAEAPIVAPETPPGFVDFFVGPRVLEAIATDGAFLPSEDVDYSMIRLPQWMVDDALRTLAPVTVSLCDPDHGIVLFDQRTGEIYHALGENTTNCTPWIQHYEGRTTTEFRSGMEGVFGQAQVGLLGNGNLYAGAGMEERIPDACGHGSFGNGAMLLGTLRQDAAPDDELVETCVAPPMIPDGKGF